jgi:hypothetical protein
VTWTDNVVAGEITARQTAVIVGAAILDSEQFAIDIAHQYELRSGIHLNVVARRNLSRARYG